MNETTNEKTNEKTYVWDPLIRIFHWSLVLAFIIAYFTGDEENALHVYSGYYILGLLAFRLFWGLVGSKYARFSSFTFAPSAVMKYLSSLFSKNSYKHYIGHNPAGSWMVIIMLVSLFITGFSGLKLQAAEGEGPLAQNTFTSESTQPEDSAYGMKFIKVSRNERDHDDDDDEDEKDKRESRGKHDHEDEDEEGEEFWEDIHELFANFTVLLVILHILGVIASSTKQGQNLVRAMITGYK